MLGYPGPEIAINTAAWLATMAVAVVVLGKGFGNASSRAVGLYLLDITLLGTAFNLMLMERDPAGVVLWERAATLFAIAGPFLAFQFIASWPRPRWGLRPWARVALIWGPIAALEAHFLLVPDAWAGTLLMLAYATWFVVGVAMYVALHDFARSEPGPVREALFYVGVTLAMVVLVDTVYWTLTGFPAGPAPVPFAAWALSTLTLYLYAVVLVRYATRWRRAAAGTTRRQDLAFVLFPLTAVVGALAAAAAFHLESPARGVEVWELAGSVACAGGLGVFTYAAVKHQSLGLDLRVKWAVRRGSVAGAFVAVFFVGTEGAKMALEGWMGPVLGLAAAGVLVFALAPLQRLADRLGEAALPGVKPIREMDLGERQALYLDQARFAWADGMLSAKDRQILDVARQRLGLSHEQTAAMERRVLAGAASPRGAAPVLPP